MSNPFKFGSVVEGEYFTDRETETTEISEILSSANNLILISPRRFGKTSLILKVAAKTKRPVIYIDLMSVTDAADFASSLLRRILKIKKIESIKQILASFRVAPHIDFDAVSGNMNVTFLPVKVDSFAPLEDVLNLIEKISKPKKKPIVILDEFQQITTLGKGLTAKLRSVIQFHKGVNYVFLGSMESMMKEIFTDKKSPFYHFGHLMNLDRLPYDAFFSYLDTRLQKITKEHAALSKEILKYTDRHPYYAQQLAYYCYAYLQSGNDGDLPMSVIAQIINNHSNDYEMLWRTIRNTDKKILITFAAGENVSTINQPTSTVYSGITRLTKQGYLTKNGSYGIDDPFFKEWILKLRS